MLARVARFAGSGCANAIAHRGVVSRNVARTFQSTRPTMMADQAKGVWDEPGTYSHPEGTPDGFTLRVQQTAENPTGVDVMMEKWEKGSEEPIHSHPGDDMTIVVEGKMSLQFFIKGVGGELIKGNVYVVHYVRAAERVCARGPVDGSGARGARGSRAHRPRVAEVCVWLWLAFTRRARG